MTRLTILEYPDPRLRLCSEPVTVFDDRLSRWVDDLIETMHAGQAIGLSAPQVDFRREVLVIDLSEDRSAPEVYINPKILSKKAYGFVEESCLSVPGVVANVLRATQIRVRAQDRTGETFERTLEGMHAVCVQHEMDHLRGKLLVDRLSFFRRFRLRRATQRASESRAS